MNPLVILRNSSIRTYLVIVLIFLFVVFESKLFYNKMKKNARFEYYNGFVQEVQDAADRVGAADNKSHVFVLKLSKLLGAPGRQLAFNATEPIR